MLFQIAFVTALFMGGTDALQPKLINTGPASDEKIKKFLDAVNYHVQLTWRTLPTTVKGYLLEAKVYTSKEGKDLYSITLTSPSGIVFQPFEAPITEDPEKAACELFYNAHVALLSDHYCGKKKNPCIRAVNEVPQCPKE